MPRCAERSNIGGSPSGDIVLRWIVRKLILPEYMKRIFTCVQLLAYADDIALITRKLPDLKEFFNKLERTVKEVGLEVNQEKRACELLQLSVEIFQQ
jgi:hypothetical protein